MALGSEKQYNTFVKGFITEASPLTFPENASLDEDNFVLQRDGSRSRRLGVDYEAGYSFKDSGYNSTILADSKVSFHRWDSPGGNTNLAIGIVRVQDRLWFMNLLSNSPSDSYLNGGTYLTITNLSTSDIDTTVINNNLVLVSEELALPILLKYDTDTDTVTQSFITIQVRDIWGVEDENSITTRPVVLSDEHKYNLRNQNWTQEYIDSTFTSLTYYPSNADIWFLSKFSDPSKTNYNNYNPATLVRTNTFNAQSPRGSIILDAFNRGSDRQTLISVPGVPLDRETGAISTVAAYAGRLFYSGVTSQVTEGDNNSPNYSGYIFFSQVVTSNEILGKCYQQQDPTAEDISDLVDSDGGTIHIPDASKIVKILPSKGSLMVFGENGIWELYGASKGFTATTFQVSKISSTGIISKNSVVEVNGSFIAWTKAGIYLISENDVDGRYKAENISLQTIQSYYNSLSEITKLHVKAYFDERENKVRWLYNNSEDYEEGNFVNYYNKELILDLTLGAFYRHSFSDLEEGSPKIAGYISFPGFSVNTLDTAVYAGNEEVLVTAGDTVITSNPVASARGSQFGFLTFTGTEFTISKYTDSSFTDWKTEDGTGVSYESYLVTGYDTFGEIFRGKQIPYILFYFDRTENGFTEVDNSLEIDNPSSCIVQAQWDWANSVNSGKWGTPFQAYRLKRFYIPSGANDNFDYGYRVIVTKNKLRGSGRALSLKISSEPNKDIKLLGWAMRIEADELP